MTSNLVALSVATVSASAGLYIASSCFSGHFQHIKKETVYDKVSHQKPIFVPYKSVANRNNNIYDQQKFQLNACDEPKKKTTAKHEALHPNPDNKNDKIVVFDSDRSTHCDSNVFLIVMSELWKKLNTVSILGTSWGFNNFIATKANPHHKAVQKKIDFNSDAIEDSSTANTDNNSSCCIFTHLDPMKTARYSIMSSRLGMYTLNIFKTIREILSLTEANDIKPLIPIAQFSYIIYIFTNTIVTSYDDAINLWVQFLEIFILGSSYHSSFLRDNNDSSDTKHINSILIGKTLLLFILSIFLLGSQSFFSRKMIATLTMPPLLLFALSFAMNPVVYNNSPSVLASDSKNMFFTTEQRNLISPNCLVLNCDWKVTATPITASNFNYLLGESSSMDAKEEASRLNAIKQFYKPRQTTTKKEAFSLCKINAAAYPRHAQIDADNFAMTHHSYRIQAAHLFIKIFPFLHASNKDDATQILSQNTIIDAQKSYALVDAIMNLNIGSATAHNSNTHSNEAVQFVKETHFLEGFVVALCNPSCYSTLHKTAAQAKFILFQPAIMMIGDKPLFFSEEEKKKWEENKKKLEAQWWRSLPPQ